METMAVMEYATFVTLAPLLVRTRAADPHPVLVLPGFTASDRSTRPLRKALADAGHSVHGWGLGPNVGPHPHVLRGLQQRVLDLTGRYGRTVSLVGWSLGGIYARELARADPDHVRLVITLGSPYRFRPGDRGHASELYAAVAPEHDPFPGRLLPEDDRPAVPVPSTSIYTRTDGIVHWSACIDGSGPQRENIEVVGTHSGLGFNLAALIAIIDRLSQPEGGWKPFRPSPFVRHLYPWPAGWWRGRRPRPATAARS